MPFDIICFNGRMKLSTIFKLLLLILPILLYFLTRGIITHDEGYILHSASKILDGQVPYRDFHFVYTPGSIYITALSFAIFSPTVLTSRILMIIISLVTVTLTYLIVMRSTNNKMYAILASIIFVAWGPSHTNFSWPVMYAISSGLLTMYLLSKSNNTTQKQLFLAGLLTFSVFWFKQNFGIAMALPIILFFLFNFDKKITSILSFAYGLIWGLIIFLIYLLATESFAPFIIDFLDFTLKRIVINGALTTSFFYFDSIIPFVLRSTLYLLPAILSIACMGILIIRKRYHLLFIPSFVLAFYIVGIRPTTDYVHLTPLLSLIGLPIAIILRYSAISTIRQITILLVATTILMGFHTALFKGYYRWDEPITKHDNLFLSNNVNIFINEKSSNTFRRLTEITTQHTQKNDYILVNSYHPLFYFITQRQEPIQDNYLRTDIDPVSYYHEVLGQLVAKDIKLIILPTNSIESIPIAEFVSKNYNFLETLYDHDIYLKKSLDSSNISY